MTTDATPTPAAPTPDPTEAPTDPGVTLPSGETPAADPPPEEKRDPASTAFAALARKERALLDRERKLKADREQWERDTAPIREARELMGNGKGLDALEKLGLRYEDVTLSVLGRPKVAPADAEREAMRRELEDIKGQMTAREKRELDTARDTAVHQVRSGVTEHLKQQAEKFPVLASMPDGVDQVYGLIERHAQQTAEAGNPELLDYDVAAQQVEQQLRAGLDVLAPIFRRLYGSAVGPDGAEPTSGQPTGNSQSAPDRARTAKREGPATLTNQAASETSVTPIRPGKTAREIDRERIRRATALG